MIQREQCVERKLYRIHSRNLRFGVYDAHHKGFIGIRTKFKLRFAFMEYHWENGPPYGTVKPEEELPEELPADIDLCVSYPWSECGDCGGKMKYIEWEPGAAGNGYPGRWRHLESDTCTSINAMAVENVRLFKWLEAMEEKYAQGGDDGTDQSRR